MKDFFKYMTATICGIIVLTIIGGILFALTLMGMLASDDTKVRAEENSVFVLKFNGTVEERSEDDNPLNALLGSTGLEEMGLDDILKAIRLARDEENIKGIYLEGGAATFDSPATAQQIRDALADFQKSGKWIYAYGDQFMQACYYVCSVADSLFLNTTGMIDFKGLGDKHEYMTGLYEKLGIKYQTARVGKYKSYVESVTRKDMSAEDREQREAYLTGIWKQWTEQIAESRNLTAADLDSLASDSIMVFASVSDYKQAGLIDRAFFPEEMKEVVRRTLKLDKDADIKQLTLTDMLNLKPAKKVKERGGEVAVYYAYGEIIDELVSGFASSHSIVGTTTVSDLQELAKNDDVKAVVLRVNSGGGSAVASEQIWHAIEQLKAKKPVVVSMGGVAASGGYMISCGANYIYAEPTTITGSIGIFGLIPNFSGLVTDKLGITWDGVTTNKYSDYETNLIFGDENSDEMRFLQGYTDRGYERFLEIVGSGRNMTKDEVNEIAQGRVWLATDALGINLVDELGSLDNAVKKAAELAKMDEYHTASYPAKTDWIDELLSTDEETASSYLNSQLRQALGDLYEPVMQLRQDQMRNRLQARLPYSVNVK
ncbi:MAG: signal peptide peptidase SppA [Prevotella sp.]|nr:signal peptide peptidase SppA [Prevotella sp.]